MSSYPSLILEFEQRLVTGVGFNMCTCQNETTPGRTWDMCIVSDQHGNDFICLNLMTCCTKNENCTALLSAALNFLRTCPTWAQTQMVSLHLPNSFQHAAKPFKSSEPGKCCLSDLWRLWQGLLDSHENRAVSSEFRAENRARIEQARLRIEQESSEFKTKAENRGESSKVSRRFRGESSESSGFEPEPAQPQPRPPTWRHKREPSRTNENSRNLQVSAALEGNCMPPLQRATKTAGTYERKDFPSNLVAALVGKVSGC